MVKQAAGVNNERMKEFAKKIAGIAAEKLAEDVYFTIEQLYEDNVERFYNDYTPKSYKRTYATYEASTGYKDANGSTATAYKNIKKRGNRYEVGIRVSSNNILGKPYFFGDTEQIFTNTFVYGSHGNKIKGRYTPRTMSISPKKGMDADFKSFATRQHIDGWSSGILQLDSNKGNSLKKEAIQYAIRKVKQTL